MDGRLSWHGTPTEYFGPSAPESHNLAMMTIATNPCYRTSVGLVHNATKTFTATFLLKKATPLLCRDTRNNGRFWGARHLSAAVSWLGRSWRLLPRTTGREWVEFNSPLDTIQVISEAHKTTGRYHRDVLRQIGSKTIQQDLSERTSHWYEAIDMAQNRPLCRDCCLRLALCTPEESAD